MFRRKHKDQDTDSVSSATSQNTLAATPMPTSGRPGHLTQSEQAMLEAFRAKIVNAKLYEPSRHDDACLCRFLRARKWDLEAALAMFTDAETWRREFNVDHLYNTFEFPEKAAVDELYPQFYHKTDKDGRPVYIEQLGKVDLKALWKVTTPERILQKLVVEYEKFQRERLPVCSAEREELIETSCTIMDLKNVGISQFWKVSSYVQQASKIGQYYYPETMGKFYIINAPYIFTTVWSVVKGWLDPVTTEKIRILGSGYERELAAQIPVNNLPEFLGGKSPCPVGNGTSIPDDGPWNTPRGHAIIQQAQADRQYKIQLFQQHGANAEAAAIVAKQPLIPSVPTGAPGSGSAGSSTVGTGAATPVGAGATTGTDAGIVGAGAGAGATGAGAAGVGAGAGAAGAGAAAGTVTNGDDLKSAPPVGSPTGTQPGVVQPAGIAADPHVPPTAHLGSGGPIVSP